LKSGFVGFGEKCKVVGRNVVSGIEGCLGDADDFQNSEPEKGAGLWVVKVCDNPVDFPLSKVEGPATGFGEKEEMGSP
jgi:hypothetical protein